MLSSSKLTISTSRICSKACTHKFKRITKELRKYSSHSTCQVILTENMPPINRNFEVIVTVSFWVNKFNFRLFIKIISHNKSCYLHGKISGYVPSITSPKHNISLLQSYFSEGFEYSIKLIIYFRAV